MSQEDYDWSDEEQQPQQAPPPKTPLTAEKAPRRQTPRPIELKTEGGRTGALVSVKMQDSREFLVPHETDLFLIIDPPVSLEDEQEAGDVFKAMFATLSKRNLEMNDVCGYALSGEEVVAFVLYNSKVLVLTEDIEKMIVENFRSHLGAPWTATISVNEPLDGVIPLKRFLDIGLVEAGANEHTNLRIDGRSYRPVVSSTRLTQLHPVIIQIPSRDGKKVDLVCEPMPSNYKMHSTTEGARMCSKGTFFIIKHAPHVFGEIARPSDAVKVVHTYAKANALVLNDLCGIAVFSLGPAAGKTNYSNYTVFRFFVFSDATEGPFQKFTVVLGTGQMENDGAIGILASKSTTPEADQIAVDSLKEKFPDIVAMCDDPNVRVDLWAVLQFGTADFSASNLHVDGRPVVPLTSSLRLRNLCGPKRKRAVAEGAPDEHRPVTKRQHVAHTASADLIRVPDPFESSPVPEGVPLWFADLVPDADGWDALLSVGRQIRENTDKAKKVLDYSDATKALVEFNKGATEKEATFNTRRTSAALVFVRAMIPKDAAGDADMQNIWQIADSLVQKHFARWFELDPNWKPPVHIPNGEPCMELESDAAAQPDYAKAAASILLSIFSS